MSEEKIMKECKDIIRILDKTCENGKSKNAECIRNLLDLYNKEKEKREIAEENHKVLSLDLGQALKDLGLPEDTIIADELVLEINKKYISKDKIRKDLETCQKVYEEEMKPYQRDYGLDVTYLSKKEKEKLVNKRNCLITQMKTYEMLLED